MTSDLSTGEPDWNELRLQMPVARKWAYFDHAAVAPISGPANDAIKAWARQAVEEGDTIWSQWAARIEQVRATAASMVGADVQEIGLVPNTTAGINLVAEGFPWRDGDNVVTLAGEFPSNIYPWLNLASRGVETRRVEFDDIAVDLNRIADACDQRTRIVSVSWIGYATGWRIDIGQLVELAHSRGILVFLDAIQGLGVFPLDVRQTAVDFFAADGHKWLLSPEGAGIFFMRREHLDLLRPLGIGWNSVVQGHDFSNVELNLRHEAARYEGGSQNMAGFCGLGASLELLARFGLTSTASPIAERVLELNCLTASRLKEIGARIISPCDPRKGSGIVAFELPGCNPNEVRRHCLQRGVALSTRAGRLRISPHAYVNEDDVDRLIFSLRD